MKDKTDVPIYSLELDSLENYFAAFHEAIFLEKHQLVWNVKPAYIKKAQLVASQHKALNGQGLSILKAAADYIYRQGFKAAIPSYDLTDENIWEILRREHILYLEKCSEFNKQGKITRLFRLSDCPYEFKSIQGRLRNDLAVLNCYHRWLELEEEPKAASFREHFFKTGDEILVHYFHQASPVVQTDKLERRIEGTKKVIASSSSEMQKKLNPEQPEKVHVTHVRLLSTNKGLGGNFQEAFEHYVSALTTDNPPTVFFYGVNMARHFRLSRILPKALYSGGLQTWINTRASNEMYEKIFDNLKILKPLNLPDIESKRKILKAKIQSIMDDDQKDKKTKQRECLDLMKTHHRSEQRLQSFYRKLWNGEDRTLTNYQAYKGYSAKQQQLIQSVETYHKLLKANRYLSSGYNGQIQATLVELNCQLGEAVSTGCFDAKDRDGMVTLTVEANAVYRKTYSKNPDIFDKSVRQELKKIQKQLMKKSTPAPVAEALSMPDIAKGLDNTTQPFSGFGEMENPFMSLAGTFKKLYGHVIHPLDFSYQRKDPVKQTEKNMDYPYVDGESYKSSPEDKPKDFLEKTRQKNSNAFCPGLNHGSMFHHANHANHANNANISSRNLSIPSYGKNLPEE